ncbi:hypothetical protein CPB86DRAFT_247673 [Serendipita vermifera]|nr:hypothetical protein CPB86DRAFT_247673 [Serendipita vermifera]
MLFPTTLILAVLSITPAFAVPVLTVDSDASSLVARDEPQQVILQARGESYGLDLDMMEKRDLADEESFVELVARSPEPEPLPEPFPLGELEEDMERRGLFGLAFKAAKGIAKGVKAIKKAHDAKQHYNNHRNRHHKRSWKSFWRKVGGGIKKAVKGVSAPFKALFPSD